MTGLTIREDADRIREAMIGGVRPQVLVPRRLAVADDELLLDRTPLVPPVPLAGRIVVVGGGKAAAGMAAAVETLLASVIDKGRRVAGLVSVPEGCGLSLRCIEVRETRPPALNLPTPAAVDATRTMRTLIGQLGPADLAIVIVTGGGSALLAEPRKGVSLAEKIAVTSRLSAAGADIRELNTVRQSLSAVKAGGLARACAAGRLVAVVLSDVGGDPLDLIASGPCMPVPPDPAAALDVLRRHGGLDVAPAVTRLLEHEATISALGHVAENAGSGEWTTPRGCRVSHVLLGTNATAVDAAAAAARDLGYDVTVRYAATGELAADAIGGRLAREAADLVAGVRRDGRCRAIVDGGEATVALPADHGLGGRNQQTVLAAFAAWQRDVGDWPAGLAIASIGTDGEDGPTAAAGGILDAAAAAVIAAGELDVARAVARCDAYPLLDAIGGLIRTGPTGTNVADVRLILARP